jgi:Phosphotransferase enzyme family
VTPMPRSLAAIASIDDTALLRTQLEKCLAEHFGRARAIKTIERRLCPYTSSFQLDELTVRFEDGTHVDLMLKVLGRAAMVEEARRGRPDFLYSPLREIDVYRWILPHAPAGTPTWYGAVSDVAADRVWLFLERVEGVQLTQVGSFEAWERAVAWIARFHAAASPLRASQLADRSGTLVYDAGFYGRWMRRAQAFMHGTSERRVIRTIARRYDAVIERLTAIPPTLIHGEFYACNVLVGGTDGTGRICPVDWEMAAYGPGLIDLAALSAGWTEVKQRALARAYYAASRAFSRSDDRTSGARLPRGFLVNLDCCRLHLCVRMLGWSDAWEPPPDHAHDWLAEAERLMHRLQS